jgi:hypothetical protein
LAQQRVVIGLALREAPHAVVGPRERLLPNHLGAKPLVSRRRAGLPGSDRAASQLGLLRSRNVELGHLLAEIVENCVSLQHRAGARGQEVVDVGKEVGIDPLWRHDAAVGALARFGDQLIERGTESEQPRNVRLCVARIGDAVDVDQEGGHLTLPAVHLVEDVAEVPIGEPRRRAPRHAVEQPVRKRVLLRQVPGIEQRPHRPRGRLQPLVIGNIGGIREIVPAAVILVADSAIGFGQRRLLEIGLVIGFEEPRELFVALGRRDRRTLGRSRRRDLGRSLSGSGRNHCRACNQ